ncbi:MAG: zinc ribbon domain-containing protein [Desulfovibrionaceae bacterium]|nr:zinc ribbon domain-containing protein [Desulfovibrionaceae bacterium]MBR5734257.1 zinc ribbon domain-containing protein [Desulfovibrionaceae bacterium]
MPIYEYYCTHCDRTFEEWTQHHDAPASMCCPKCGGEAGRIVSNTSFMLKGKGWYVTEYGTHRGKSEGGPASAPSQKPNDSAAIAKAETPAAPAAPTAESKPAPAPASGSASAE